MALTLTAPATVAVPSDVPAQTVAPARGVTVTTSTKVEMVRYRDGKTDRKRPFKPLVGGDAVFIRVTVATGKAGLPSGAARLRLQFGNDLADATVRMAERDGVRRCLRIDLTAVSCLIGGLLAGDEASMLVTVVVPPGLEATDLWFQGSVVAVRDLVVKAQPTYARVTTVGRGPWSGTWHWYATWPSGAFDSNGMQIYQPRDSTKRVVCATWPWAGGGVAWGPIDERGVWQALWRDGFGEGTWRVSLSSADEFTGTQPVDVHNGADFTADITGRRTSAAVPALDCDAIYERVQ